MRSQLTQERLKQVIHYDPESGIFSWIVSRVGPKTRNNVAGSCAGSKYRFISVDGQRYMASHLAWLYMTGELPTAVIDHINQDKIDDRWCNLRKADHSQNRANTGLRASNRSGIKGVRWNRKMRRWYMQFQCREVRQNSFHDTAEEAAEAYRRLAIEHYGEYVPPVDVKITQTAERNIGSTKIKRANRERIRRWYVAHVGGTRKECAAALGLSEAAVARHVRDLRLEWLGDPARVKLRRPGDPTHFNRQSTQNSILDLYKVVTE